MTVKTLIEKLRTVDQKAEVYLLFDDEGIRCRPREWVEEWPWWVRSPVTNVTAQKQRGRTVVELWNEYP